MTDLDTFPHINKIQDSKKLRDVILYINTTFVVLRLDMAIYCSRGILGLVYTKSIKWHRLYEDEKSN